MRVIKVTSKYGCNSYILTKNEKRAVLIDCGDESVLDRCKQEGLKPVAVLLTHGHFDHVIGCGKCYKSKIPIYCGMGERDYIFSSDYLDISGGVYIPFFKVAYSFVDGEKVTLAGMQIEVLATKGHSAGSVCYLVEDCLFSGDTLFRGSVGRTDFGGGDHFAMYDSIRKLFALKGNLKVYCGHGEDTTLDYERKNNIYAHIK